MEVYMRRVINVGILGAGRIAVMMAQTVRRMMKAGMGDVELYCVASRDTLRAMEFAKNNGVTHAYGSYEEMLQDPNLDLVYVATAFTSQ